MRQVLGAGALGWPRGMGWGGRREWGSEWGTHIKPWLIHVNVWQKPLQYCKVINLQQIKNKWKKKKFSKRGFINTWSMNFQMLKVRFRKAWRTRDQIANIYWIIKKAREFQKNIYFCFTDYAKAFDFVDHNKLWKILKERGIPDNLTCLLRNRYAGQEATIRIGHGTTDWFQIGKGVHQGCILSPCLFNLYSEYIMRNTGLEETQAGSKTSRRNISNLRYTDDTTLMTESEEELKTLLMKVKKKTEKKWLKAQHSENKHHGIWPHHFMGNRWGNIGNSVRLYFWGLQNYCRWWLQPWY